MLIRYIFGPRAGEVEHVDRVSAKPLILAQIAEAVNPEDLKDPNDGVVRAVNETYRLPKAGDARIPEPEFTVEILRNQFTDTSFLGVVMTQAGQRTVYNGNPQKINDKRTWPGGFRWLNGFGRECPADVAKEYARQWKANEHLRKPENAINNPVNEAMKSQLAQRG